MKRKPLNPAPTGAALDDLLFECVEQIENYPLHHGQLADDLRPCSGRHAVMLVYGADWEWQIRDDGTPDPRYPSHHGGGVYRYITEGN